MGAELFLPGMKRRQAKVAGILHLLLRMEDVVDFAILLGPPGLDVGWGQGVSGESVELGFAQVGGRCSLHHRFGHRPADASGVCNPDRFRHPKTSDVR